MPSFLLPLGPTCKDTNTHFKISIEPTNNLHTHFLSFRFFAIFGVAVKKLIPFRITKLMIFNDNCFWYLQHLLLLLFRLFISCLVEIFQMTALAQKYTLGDKEKSLPVITFTLSRMCTIQTFTGCFRKIRLPFK